LTLHALLPKLKSGWNAAFIDAEHAFDRNYAEKLGVDIENLIISQPDNGEQALEIAENLIRSGAIDIVVIDSVAALTPKGRLKAKWEILNGTSRSFNVASLKKINGNNQQNKLYRILH
jgi:recombination protein RecA